jgi:four helix bundle protein
MALERFEDIKAWQAGRTLTQAVYSATCEEPFARDYRLRDQIQGAAISILANIAEGFDSDTNPEFIRFLGYARRSASEVQSLLYVALDLAYVTPSDFDRLYEQARSTKALVGGLVRYLKANPDPRRTRRS